MAALDSAGAATALRRLTFGPRPGDIGALVSQGLTAWLLTQLYPTAENQEVTDALNRAAFATGAGYPGPNDVASYVAQLQKNYARHGPFLEIVIPVDANAGPEGFKWLNATSADLWAINVSGDLIPPPGSGLNGLDGRPYAEFLGATMIRQVHSNWQLRELMVAFWHDHFSINVTTSGAEQALTLAYDRDTVRPRALGNFRNLLYAVTSHPLMLYYLNNNTSKVGAANENFARELQELYTLGIGNYVEGLYSSANAVPLNAQGMAIGYTEQDVKQIALALTGWTVADGYSLPYHGTGLAPNTGTGILSPDNHSFGPKRVLGVALPGTDTLSDGLQVIDLLINHPGTAQFLVRKIAYYLMGAQAPQTVIDAGVQAWSANVFADDQIAQVLFAMASHPDFLTTPAQRVRSGGEHLVWFMRVMGGTLNYREDISGYVNAAGDVPWAWPSPAGRPKNDDAWLTTFSTLGRINGLNNLAIAYPGYDGGRNPVRSAPPGGLYNFDPFAPVTPSSGTRISAQDVAAFWSTALNCAGQPALILAVAKAMVYGGDPTAPLDLTSPYTRANVGSGLALMAAMANGAIR